MTPEVGAAFELGRAQLERLRSGDFDAYEAALPHYEAACSALSTLDASTFERDDDDLLRELIAIERAAALELARLTRETAARMTSIRKGGRAAAAYLAAPPPVAGRVTHA